jgi:hypothetical protein
LLLAFELTAVKKSSFAEISCQVGKDFKMETVFGVPVINILWVIVAGKR